MSSRLSSLAARVSVRPACISPCNAPSISGFSATISRSTSAGSTPILDTPDSISFSASICMCFNARWRMPQGSGLTTARRQWNGRYRQPNGAQKTQIRSPDATHETGTLFWRQKAGFQPTEARWPVSLPFPAIIFWDVQIPGESSRPRVDADTATNSFNATPPPGAGGSRSPAMLVPKKNRQAVYRFLFAEGVCYALKDFGVKHPEIKIGEGEDDFVPNLHVIKMMQSFKSKEYVTERFAWRHYYWFLTDKGIAYLREYLNIPEDVVPQTLMKTNRTFEKMPPRGDRGPRDDRGPRGDRGPRDDRGPRGDRGPRDDRGGYRPRGDGPGGDKPADKAGAPADFRPTFGSKQG